MGGGVEKCGWSAGDRGVQSTQPPKTKGLDNRQQRREDWKVARSTFGFSGYTDSIYMWIFKHDPDASGQRRLKPLHNLLITYIEM